MTTTFMYGFSGLKVCEDPWMVRNSRGVIIIGKHPNKGIPSRWSDREGGTLVVCSPQLMWARWCHRPVEQSLWLPVPVPNVWASPLMASCELLVCSLTNGISFQEDSGKKIVMKPFQPNYKFTGPKVPVGLTKTLGSPPLTVGGARDTVLLPNERACGSSRS